MGESDPWTSLKHNVKSSDGYIHKFLWFASDKNLQVTNLKQLNKDRKFVRRRKQCIKFKITFFLFFKITFSK